MVSSNCEVKIKIVVIQYEQNSIITVPTEFDFLPIQDVWKISAGQFSVVLVE